MKYEREEMDRYKKMLEKRCLISYEFLSHSPSPKFYRVINSIQSNVEYNLVANIFSPLNDRDLKQFEK